MSILPYNKQWIAHTGRKARTRYLTRVCSEILNSKDPQIIELIKRTREAVGPVFTDYGSLLILTEAKELSDSTEVTFVEAVEYLLLNLSTSVETIVAEEPKIESV